MGFSFFSKKEKQREPALEQKSKTTPAASAHVPGGELLVPDSIRIGQKSVSKDEAIEMAGQLLADGGYVLPEYIAAMKEREKVMTTYIGEGIAIPHGVGTAKDKILKSGISIIQFPDGVSFGEEKTAYLVIGIAGKDNGHMQIISNLAELIQDAAAISELFKTKDKTQIYNAFML